MKQQTVVEWLVNNLPERFKNAIINACAEEIEQAKQKEKDWIIHTYWVAYKEGRYSGDKTAEEYYNETFKDNI